ncbi:MAG: diguanylate cyclase [Desulfocurvibacter africanus]
MNLLRADKVRLTKRDLVRWEHFIKDELSEFVAFTSYSLYFPHSGSQAEAAWKSRSFDPARGEALYLPDEQRLFLPLSSGGDVLGVFVAKGVALPAPQVLPHLLTQIGELVLDKLLLYRAGISDPLTGLFNSSAFLHALEREIELIQNCMLPEEDAGPDTALTPFSGRCGLLVMDVDHFQRINDACGYTFGEQCLAELGKLLKELCPDPSIAGRIGEDQFALLCPDASPAACQRLAERIQRAVAGKIFEDPLTGEQLALTVSIGSANYPADLRGSQLRQAVPERARILLRKARKALATAKAHGRSRSFAFERILADGGNVLEILPLNRLSVSLGRRVDAQEGMRFLVASREWDREAEVTSGDGERLTGRYPAMYKGEVMLVEVQEDMAFADVLHMSDAAWPIAPGDRLTLVPKADTLPGDGATASGATSPDLLTGLHAYRGFMESFAQARLDAECFTLALVRITAGEQRSLQPSAFLKEVDTHVREVAELSRDLFGPDVLAGRYSLNSICYYLPGQPPKAHMERFTELVTAAQERLGLILAAGLASYPFLAYTKAEIVENCRKALDHALMLPQPMVAMFDSISLNVSADRHFAQGDLYAAVEEYKRSLLADQENHLAANSLGICYARLGRPEQALTLFESVAAKHPEDLMAAYNLGTTSLRLGEFERARAAFERCLKLKPGHVYSLIRLGQLAERDNDLPTAGEYYLRASETKIGRILTMRHLARLDLAEGRFEEARENLHQALILNPYDAMAVHLMAKLYLEAGEDPEIAETLARQSVTLKPDKAQYWRLLAQALEACGKPDEARKAMERAESL